MSKGSLNVLAVVGSLQRESVTRVVIHHVARQLQAAGCLVDVLDFEKEPLALYNPDTAHELHSEDLVLVPQRSRTVRGFGLLQPLLIARAGPRSNAAKNARAGVEELLDRLLMG